MHLVEDLLDMSRIVSGKFSLSIRSANADEIIDHAIKAVEFAAGAKKIEIIRTASEGDMSLECDPDRIQQVLWNLLSNAVKFTKAGGQIHIKTERHEGDFVFEVADTGVGISANELPHVFDRLWQSKNVPENKKGGLGLGLRFCKDLVEAHGGQITAQSPGLGKGSVFRVSLPIRAVTLAEVPWGERDLHPLKGLTVLVVDDSEDAVELIRLALESAGAKVLTALDGAQALELVRKQDIQVIVSDINMPGPDGYSFLKNLRQMELASGSALRRPAIALTARTAHGDRERALQAGYQLHLVKPVHPKTLVEKVLSLSRSS
jgi:CheY-like chemotaxis protein